MSKIKKRTIPVSKSRYFVGEMMQCSRCGKKLKSDPQVESGWTVVVMDGSAVYICSTCWYRIDFTK